MSDSENHPKKPKLEPEPAHVRTTDIIVKTAIPESKTCAYWVKRKKRYCKMTVAKERNYCGEHEPASTSPYAEQSNRIPCPLDGKHTVYKKNLAKHLKICNAKLPDNLPPYIEKGINAGDASEPVEDHAALRLNELTDEEFYAVIDKVKELYNKFVEGQIETLQAEVKLESLQQELTNEQYGKESMKHLQQTSSLLGILANAQQLQDGTSFIEFGAGKGQLAFYLAKLLQQHKLQHSQVVLLDRMSLRHKKDNRIEDRTLVHRIRTDIADFRMCHLELLSKAPRIVAISKHLCGAATDLTLRCITQTAATGVSDKHIFTDYIMIALCCHHRCDWPTFVGKHFLQEQHISPRQFAIITKMVGWAICGTGMSRERRRALEEQSLSPQKIYEINSTQRLSLAERENIGFMCKRVLDHARLEFLRQHGYEANLKRYVPKDVTLENVCLLARKV